MENNQPNLPPVAIIVANYNGSKYVLDAIRSALVQTYPACGIFITDDCSTDNSLSVITDFLMEGIGDLIVGQHQNLKADTEYNIDLYRTKRFPVYLFSLKKNVGRGLVRNFSIEYALNNGYYLVKILDSDDIMRERCVEILTAEIIKDVERIGLSYSDYLILNEKGIYRYESKPPFDLSLLRSGNSHIHSGAMINSLALREFGLYPNISTCEDFFLFRKITFKQLVTCGFQV